MPRLQGLGLCDLKLDRCVILRHNDSYHHLTEGREPNSDFDVPYIKIDQKKISDPSIPRVVGVGDFYSGQKVVIRSSFRGHKVFVNFEHVF